MESNDELLSKVGDEIINEYGRIKLKNKLKSFDNQLNISKNRIIGTVLVAVFCLAIGIPLLMNVLNSNTSNETLFASNFTPYKTVLNVRGNEHGDELLSKGIIAYSNNNFEEAIVNLNAITNKSYVVNFYLGVSYLGIKHPDGEKALENLNKVLTADNDFKQQATWYKGLALLLTKQTKEAQTIFKKIVEKKWFNYEKALEISIKMQEK